jgi:uncharacterized protein
MARRIESFFIPGPVGRLEALLEEPESADPIEAALVCHPHPQFGGTMHNKVVYRMARALRKAGCVVLRFNYRGVNLSDGEYGHIFGEVEDAKTTLAELRGRYPHLPVTLAGFSFGSRVALHVAEKEPNLSRAIAVGFPTQYSNRDYAYNVRIPKYFVHSTHDEFGPRPEFQAFFDSLPEPKQLDWVEAEDHFFKNALDTFEGVVERIGNLRMTV